MAHTIQARKRIRQASKAEAANRARRSRIRTFVKKAETAIAAGDKKEIPVAFQAAMKELHRGVTKGLVNKATASRKISRLAASIKASA